MAVNRPSSSLLIQGIKAAFMCGDKDLCQRGTLTIQVLAVTAVASRKCVTLALVCDTSYQLSRLSERIG